MGKNANETKHDKFIRLAEARTNKALDLIKLIGNLSDKGTYEFTEEEVSKIFAHIEKELKIAKARFNGAEESKKFKL